MTNDNMNISYEYNFIQNKPTLKNIYDSIYIKFRNKKILMVWGIGEFTLGREG